jgi:hypothetical protein
MLARSTVVRTVTRHRRRHIFTPYTPYSPHSHHVNLIGPFVTIATLTCALGGVTIGSVWFMSVLYIEKSQERASKAMIEASERRTQRSMKEMEMRLIAFVNQRSG